MATQPIVEQIKDHVSRRTIIYAIVLSLYVLGVAVGGYTAFSVDTAEQVELSWTLQQFFQSIIDERAPTSISWQEIGIKVLKEVGIPWMLGLTIILAPAVLALLFLHGYSIGFSAGFLIHDLSFKGLAIGVFSMLPHQILLIAGHLVIAGAALSFAYGAGKVLVGKRDDGPVLLHLVRSTFFTLIGGVFILMGAWVQIFVTPVLVRLGAGLVL